MSALKDISVYLRLVLVLLGLVGNTLTICLMFRKKFKTSIGLYMLILAVADLGVMIFGQGMFCNFILAQLAEICDIPNAILVLVDISPLNLVTKIRFLCTQTIDIAMSKKLIVGGT